MAAIRSGCLLLLKKKKRKRKEQIGSERFLYGHSSIFLFWQLNTSKPDENPTYRINHLRKISLSPSTHQPPHLSCHPSYSSAGSPLLLPAIPPLISFSSSFLRPLYHFLFPSPFSRPLNLQKIDCELRGRLRSD